MNRYNSSKIYKIVDNTNGNIYIGSTTEPTLARRLAKHKSNYKLYLDSKYSYTSSFEIIKNNDYEIVLLENVNCNNRDELHAKERENIERYDCVNKMKRPYATEDEQNQRKLEYMKEYYEINKAKVLEYGKAYRETNKNVINQKCICDICGGKYTTKHKSEHFKSKKHLIYT